MTALFVLLWLFAVMGLACVVQRVIDAFRHANRVIDNAPTRLPDRSNVTRLHRRDGATVVRIDGKGQAS